MKLLAGLLCILALAGCAGLQPPVGRDYPRGVFAGFTLNQTSVVEAEAILGPPMSQSVIKGIVPPTSKVIAPGTPYSLIKLSYYFAPHGFGQPAQLHPTKSATLLFFDDRLVAFDCPTGIAGEVTPSVDDAALSGFTRGQTTREEVVAQLGVPTGEIYHILDTRAGESEVLYGWQRYAGGNVERRNLRIVFDKNRKMSSYSFQTDNFKGNGPNFAIPPFALPPAPSQPVPPHNNMPAPDLSHT